MQVINGDLLETRKGIIVHQVNCKGIMGAGLALKIRQKYPVVYTEYMNEFRKGKIELGRAHIVRVTQTLFVVNLCGQDEYGRNPHRQYTNYIALEKALWQIDTFATTDFLMLTNTESSLTFSNRRAAAPYSVFIPYKMGCGLGNGKWDIVKGIIERVIPYATIISPLV